jgi:spore germination protein KC
LEKTEYGFSEQKGRLHINLDVSLDAIVTESNFPINLDKAKIRRELQRELEKQLEAQSMKTFRLLQKYRTDIFNIGAYVRAFHPDLWNSINWNNTFADAKVDIDYHITIRRSGMELKNYNGHL